VVTPFGQGGRGGIDRIMDELRAAAGPFRDLLRDAREGSHSFFNSPGSHGIAAPVRHNSWLGARSEEALGKIESLDIDELVEVGKAACILLDRRPLSCEELEELAESWNTSVATCVAVIATLAYRKTKAN
jgi:hypothetical protein